MSITVMCFGRYWNESELEFEVQGTTVRFLFDTCDAFRKTPAHFGLFVEDPALSKAPYRFPRSRRLALLLESPIRGYRSTTQRWESVFGTVFTHDAWLLARGAPYEKMLYGTTWVSDEGTPLQKTGLVSFMGNITHGDKGAYPFRAQVAHHLLKDERVDCWGRGIREIEHKVDALAPYRFSVAMENCAEDHYFTEKLIDCFRTRTVPLYWGCPSIGDVFDEAGMLRFETLDELDRLIETLDEARYQALLPALEINAQRVTEYHLADFPGIYRRVAEALVARGHAGRPVGPGRRSKGVAGLRAAWEGRGSGKGEGEPG